MHDHDRPLNERGLTNAPVMAKRFVQRKEPVDLVISSTAVRALATATIFMDALGKKKPEMNQEPRIYEASVRSILEVISELPRNNQRVLFFGHNPGFSNLIDHLTGEALGNLPTCGIARIDLGIDDWKAVSKGLGTLVWLDHPDRSELE